MPRLVRAAALGLTTAVLAAHAPARPASAPRSYSAFPDLKTPTGPVEVEPGKWAEFPDFAVLHARLFAAAARPLPAAAAPAAKVRSAQLKSAADFLKRAHVRRTLGFAAGPGGLVEVTGHVNDAYRAAAAGEPDAARRGLAEERVRVLKELERQTAARVAAGTDPPADLAFARFHRLAAEGDLLALIGGN